MGGGREGEMYRESTSHHAPATSYEPQAMGTKWLLALLVCFFSWATALVQSLRDRHGPHHVQIEQSARAAPQRRHSSAHCSTLRLAADVPGEMQCTATRNAAFFFLFECSASDAAACQTSGFLRTGM